MPPYTTEVAPTAGEQGLARVVVTAADGAWFEAYLHGAHVTSWRPAGDDDERLFVSREARFEDGLAIRGGIPVCFPQFADQGPLPMHGLVRTEPWSLVAAGQARDGAAHARFRIEMAPRIPAWPNAFTCELDVRARARTLTVALTATNAGEAPFDFTAALHTYLFWDDVRRVVVRGLRGARYRDKVMKRDDDLEQGESLAVDRPLDRVYRAVPEPLTAGDDARRVAVRALGTTDTVVWNPGPQANVPPDLDAGEWRNFLCVEAAIASAPRTLAPGAAWSIAQNLEAPL
ncbi:MAG: D-hexose-6-phosphate mutarotase [Burkholderiales bacterium]